MKLIRFGEQGKEKPGILDNNIKKKMFLIYLKIGVENFFQD